MARPPVKMRASSPASSGIRFPGFEAGPAGDDIPLQEDWSIPLLASSIAGISAGLGPGIMSPQAAQAMGLKSGLDLAQRLASSPKVAKIFGR